MPRNDTLIDWQDGRYIVPDQPAVPFFPGDGIGPEVMDAARPVLDAAVRRAYGGRRAIAWFEVPAAGRATAAGLDLLPADTLDTIRRHRIAIKGPTMTPVGSGHRSINVALRQALDLYANVRPVRYFEGVAAPVVNPGAVDIVIFRENTEDVYAGIEFAAGSERARHLGTLLGEWGSHIPDDAGLGIKVVSREKSRRLVRAAVRHAVAKGIGRVTLVHKGNIMKATEGAFAAWGYEVVREEFAGRAIPAADVPAGGPPPGVVVVEDRIADAMFQDLLIAPQRFGVLATTNLNGDYLSDAAAAQVGGLGVAPGANLGDGIAVFEPTHGTAPDIAGKGLANPGSMILTGALMLDVMGWTEAGALVVDAFAATLRDGRMTRDLAAGRAGIEALSTQAFGDAVATRIG
jgi:isocitrate dehydrogenase